MDWSRASGFRKPFNLKMSSMCTRFPYFPVPIKKFPGFMSRFLGMNSLETMEKSVGKHQHRLEWELATAKIEKALQTQSQKVKHHGLVLTFEQIGVNAWNTDTTRKRSVDIGFSFEERGIDWDFTKILCTTPFHRCAVERNNYLTVYCVLWFLSIDVISFEVAYVVKSCCKVSSSYCWKSQDAWLSNCLYHHLFRQSQPCEYP